MLTPLEMHPRGPAEELRCRLERTRRANGVDLPILDELVVTRQRFALVESWRQTARAWLGEHNFADGGGQGRLSQAQCLTVIKDAAEVVQCS